MFYVYRIAFQDCQYIGCTNDLRRRKDQHNENTRKRKSKLGVFLNENGIVLQESDLSVIAEFQTRPPALNLERRVTKELDAQGVKLLNDNYTHECTRIGKHLGNTSKEYYVIDFVSHTAVPVKDLRQYCLLNGLAYKGIQRTVHGLRYCMSGHKAFYKSDWEEEPDKEKFLSGAFLTEAQIANNEEKRRRYSKMYEVQFPDGHCETVTNLDQFAKEHNLTPGTLHGTLLKGKPTKGYQALRRI